MPEYPITDRVRELIRNSIPSVLQLEIVLHLFDARPRFVAMGDIARVMGLDPPIIRQQLDDLQRRGLVLGPVQPNSAFGYNSTDARQDAAVCELMEAYRSHRVSIINLIYVTPTDKIQTFADAFRLKQNEKGDRK